ncbi:hypothetical protein HZ326_26603 [Fusarium oxysporum f. sp. albedinis]|nr:hypothetical protein HZ326_26603 [Fusarium oxysporum f. sp. albedinis]
MSRLRMSHRSILPLSRYTRKISDDDIVSTYQSQGGCGVVDGFKVSTVSHERNGVVARNNQPILPLNTRSVAMSNGRSINPTLAGQLVLQSRHFHHRHIFCLTQTFICSTRNLFPNRPPASHEAQHLFHSTLCCRLFVARGLFWRPSFSFTTALW